MLVINIYFLFIVAAVAGHDQTKGSIISENIFDSGWHVLCLNQLLKKNKFIPGTTAKKKENT